jgi:hypothetical protein
VVLLSALARNVLRVFGSLYKATRVILWCYSLHLQVTMDLGVGAVTAVPEFLSSNAGSWMRSVPRTENSDARSGMRRWCGWELGAAMVGVLSNAVAASPPRAAVRVPWPAPRRVGASVFVRVGVKVYAVYIYVCTHMYMYIYRLPQLPGFPCFSESLARSQPLPAARLPTSPPGGSTPAASALAPCRFPYSVLHLCGP